MDLLELSNYVTRIIPALDGLLLHEDNEDDEDLFPPIEEDWQEIGKILRTIERHNIRNVVIDYYISNGGNKQALRAIEKLLIDPCIKKFNYKEVEKKEEEYGIGIKDTRHGVLWSTLDFVDQIVEAFEEVQELYGEFETNWNELRLDLIENGFISKADEKLFNMVLNHKVYPPDRERIVWKEDRREAAIFCKWLDMEKSEFNKCFLLKDKSGNPRKLHDSDYKGYGVDWTDESQSSIHEILKKHGK